MQEQEIWKDIKGHEGLYQVSNLGRVKSLGRYMETVRGRRWIKERIMVPYAGRARYYSITLSKGGEQKTAQIHRLVATAFVANPDNMSCVNHKDENPLNNRAENLEWCSQEYNIRYSRQWKDRQSEVSKGLAELSMLRNTPCPKTPGRRNKPVGAFGTDGRLVGWFISTADAVAALNLGDPNKTSASRALIRQCCAGRSSTAFGYRWRYAKI